VTATGADATAMGAWRLQQKHKWRQQEQERQ
jgi:hypothetical protein